MEIAEALSLPCKENDAIKKKLSESIVLHSFLKLFSFGMEYWQSQRRSSYQHETGDAEVCMEAFSVNNKPLQGHIILIMQFQIFMQTRSQRSLLCSSVKLFPSLGCNQSSVRLESVYMNRQDA